MKFQLTKVGTDENESKSKEEPQKLFRIEQKNDKIDDDKQNPYSPKGKSQIRFTNVDDSYSGIMNQTSEVYDLCTYENANDVVKEFETDVCTSINISCGNNLNNQFKSAKSDYEDTDRLKTYDISANCSDDLIFNYTLGR